MVLSEDVLNILNYLEGYSEGGLRKREDFGLLMEFAATANNHTLFNELLFLGSAFSRLYSSLRKTDPNNEGYSLLESEFTNIAEQLRDTMAKILSVCEDNDIIDNFETKYYSNTQGSLRNLIDIANDLNKLKQVQNNEKR